MEAEYFLSLVNGQHGHFAYESGYHSDTWFDLETLCSNPKAIRPAILKLCTEIAEWEAEVICGPLIEGGFVALLTAMELERTFAYTLRVAETTDSGMFPISYELPPALKHQVEGRRVAVVNDVISAGSAVPGTLQSLKKNGAEVVGIASLAILGDSFYEFAKQKAIPIRTLLRMANNMWKPEECPLCDAGVPLQQLATH